MEIPDIVTRRVAATRMAKSLSKKKQKFIGKKSEIKGESFNIIPMRSDAAVNLSADHKSRISAATNMAIQKTSIS